MLSQHNTGRLYVGWGEVENYWGGFGEGYLVHTRGRACYPSAIQVGYMWGGVR